MGGRGQYNGNLVEIVFSGEKKRKYSNGLSA
jgi:hypothetical protein